MTLNKIKELFKESLAFPTLIRARIESTSVIGTTWNQLSIAANKKIAFSKTYYLNDGASSAVITDSWAVPIASPGISAFKKDVEVSVTKMDVKEKDDHFIFQLWRKGHLEKSLDLTDIDAHGPVYFDSELGCMAVNENCNLVAYIAEKKKPKNRPFFKYQKEDKDDDEEEESSTTTTTTVGREFAFKESWGEQMTEKCNPVIVVFDLKSEKIKVIKGLEDGSSPGQLRWTSDDNLVGIAVRARPRKLGIIYCTNRPGALFKLDLSSEEFLFLSSINNVSCKSPRIFGDDVYWLEYDIAKTNFPGPHRSVFRLMKRNWRKLDNPKILVKEAADESEVGIYNPELPENCFDSEGLTLFLSTLIGDTNYPIAIDVSTGGFTVLKEAANISVLDVNHGFIVGVHSTPVKPPSLAYATVKDLLSFKIIDNDNEEESEFFYKTLRIKNPPLHPNPKFKDVEYSSIYVGPKNGKKNIPLILWPHGGPHTVFPTSFSSTVYFFIKLGYAVLLVNYRGSLGFGQKSIDSLLGHVGDIDVKDVYQAFDEALKEFPNLDSSKVVLFGGSHGGFLVTHLAGQYPKSFRAVVARNPVVNMASMASLSDIPDWVFIESGFSYEYSMIPDPDHLKVMFEKSPIAHVSKVRAPVLLCVGSVDLRVPPSQSHEYYHALKSRGHAVEMYVYEDCHPLSKVNVHTNVMINTALFFDKALR